VLRLQLVPPGQKQKGLKKVFQARTYDDQGTQPTSILVRIAGTTFEQPKLVFKSKPKVDKLLWFFFFGCDFIQILYGLTTIYLLSFSLKWSNLPPPLPFFQVVNEFFIRVVFTLLIDVLLQ
jgi:hypothetical protein